MKTLKMMNAYSEQRRGLSVHQRSVMIAWCKGEKVTDCSIKKSNYLSSEEKKYS